MGIKILSVDDEPDLELLMRQHFRKKTRSGEYEFLFATNGQQALDILDKDKEICILLTDINMPGMDGLELLDKVQTLNRPVLRSLVVSAYGDMENIRTAMNRGAFDFITKPIDFKDLEITIEKTINQITQLKKSYKEHVDLVALNQELSTARDIQQSLIPHKFPAFPDRNEIDIYALMQAAQNVGGDLYDFFFIDENRMGIIVGDISGKGVPAALFMALSRSIIRMAAMKGNLPDKCMEEANNHLCDVSQDSMFITVFYGILDIRNGSFVYCSAGHNLPFLLTRDGAVGTLQGTGDMVLGGIKGLNFHNNEIPLNRGDGIFIYTDGLTEAFNDQNEEYSKSRLSKELENKSKMSPNGLINRIMTDVTSFTGDAEQSDDITMLVFRYLGKKKS
ncbi:MAG TPA: SpoIIE family protein phosphatase [Bacteroidales bacterium]|nr:SpoIIE family protein phosphatase [Bacteroidales bacterium]